MVRYINEAQKAIIYAVLHAKESAEQIALEAGISPRQAYRYRKQFYLTGELFNKDPQAQNSRKFKPWCLEVSGSYHGGSAAARIAWS